MDDMGKFISQIFTNAHYTSKFHLPVATSPTYPGSEWAYQMTNDGCVTARPSNMLLSTGRKTVTILHSSCLQKVKASTKQAGICQVFKEALKWETVGMPAVSDNDVKCRRETKN
jgi:hypothetical protein